MGKTVWHIATLLLIVFGAYFVYMKWVAKRI